MQLAPEVLNEKAHAGATGVPEHQTRAGLVLNGEQIEVGADSAVITALGLFLPALVFRELLWGLPGGAIDALQLGVVLVAAPVGTGNAFQVKGLGVELFGVADVGAGAEVPPLFPQGVETDGFLNARQDFELVGLVLGLDLLFGFGAAHFKALQRKLLVDELDHFLLDGLEVGLGEGIGIIEVVIEPVFRPGPDGHLGLGKQPLDRHGHHVAHGVADAQKLLALAGLGQMHRHHVLPRITGCRLGSSGRGHGGGIATLILRSAIQTITSVWG